VLKAGRIPLGLTAVVATSNVRVPNFHPSSAEMSIRIPFQKFTEI
jgi:hypothetical protein